MSNVSRVSSRQNLSALVPSVVSIMSQLDTSALGPTDVAGAPNDHPESTPNDAVPIELIYEMISYIPNDISTLRSCSLVCKAWIHLSRQHLFQWINLDHRNIEAFVSLLQSRSGSSIGACVGHLRINRDTTDPAWMEEAVPILSLYLHPTSLYLNIRNCVGAGGLGYSEESRDRVAEDLSVFHNAFQEVVHLKFGIKCDTFEEGAELLATFPLLEALSLRRDWYPWGEAQISYDTMLPSHVRRISTCYGEYGLFFIWLLDQPQPQVSTLILDSNPITKSLSSYIQSSGTNLKHFSFHPNFPGNLDMIRISQGVRLAQDYIDLTHNSALRSLTLHPMQEVILTVLRVLSQVRSNDVEKVAIIALCPLSPPVDGDPQANSPERWLELDHLFSTPRFSKLKRVGILFSGYPFHAREAASPLQEPWDFICSSQTT